MLACRNGRLGSKVPAMKMLVVGMFAAALVACDKAAETPGTGAVEPQDAGAVTNPAQPVDAGPAVTVWLANASGTVPFDPAVGKLQAPVSLVATVRGTTATQLETTAALEGSGIPVEFEFSAANVDGGCAAKMTISDPQASGRVKVAWLQNVPGPDGGMAKVALGQTVVELQAAPRPEPTPEPKKAKKPSPTKKKKSRKHR